ncbi:MAG: hypothetical protein V4616_12125, partial [Bacteroidota bacterium]
MKTLLLSGLLVLTSLTAVCRKPKLVVNEATKCKISQESLKNSGAPTVALENGEGYTVESFQVCMKTAQGMECFTQAGTTIQKGAKDNLKL